MTIATLGATLGGMEYVMIPVPEELVDQVKSYAAWRAAAPKVAANPEALRIVYDEADAALRAIIDYTAQHTCDDGLPSLMEMADEIDMTPREVVGAIGELHSRVVAAGRKSPFIMLREDPREIPDGRSDWEHRVIHMSEADAAVISAF